MSNIIIKKEHEIVSIEKATRANIKALKEKEHLCGFCENGCPSACPKVKDFIKKDIGEYDFIVDGYQTFDKNGDLDKFIVSNCNNYIQDKPRNFTKKQLEYYRQLKVKMKTGYFGVETMDEANILQYELAEAGKLTNIKGRMLTKSQVLKLKSKK